MLLARDLSFKPRPLYDSPPALCQGEGRGILRKAQSPAHCEESLPRGQAHRAREYEAAPAHAGTRQPRPAPSHLPRDVRGWHRRLQADGQVTRLKKRPNGRFFSTALPCTESAPCAAMRCQAVGIRKKVCDFALLTNSTNWYLAKE